MQRQFVPTSLIPGLIGLAAEIGVNLASVFKRAGLDADLLSDPDGVISTHQLDSLIVALKEDLNDPAFALHLGEAIRVDQLQIVGSLIATSDNAEHALRQFLRFKDLIHPYGELILTDEGENFSMVYHADSEQAAASQFYYAELYFAGVVSIGRMLTGEDNVIVHSVSFTHPEPEYTEEFERIFEVKPTFSAEQNRIVADAKVLKIPLSGSFPNYHKTLEEKALRNLSSLPNEDSVTCKVIQYLESRMGYAVASVEAAAETLNMTSRTLQRRLRAENTTYAVLRDEVRYRYARKYLKQPDMDMESIAAALGFSEAANFYPAFKRWSGLSPGEYRRKHLG